MPGTRKARTSHHETPQAILRYLYDNPKTKPTISRLAEVLNEERSSIKRLLRKLLAEDLVEFTVQRQERGRPSHVYQLTAKGRALGPTFDNLGPAIVHPPQVNRTTLNRGILEFLYARRGGAGTRISEIVAHLQANRGSTHLAIAALKKSGLIEVNEQRTGHRGGPALLCSITSQGAALAPDFQVDMPSNPDTAGN